jgi:hypothetical protein
LFRLCRSKEEEATIQCLHDPNQSNVDNLDDVKREASTYFGNKKKGYMKAEL